MSVDWVDFQRVKQAVSIAAVLHDYGIDWLRPSGRRNHLRGRCPLHGQGGEDAFHADLQKNAFQCFCCQRKGNVLDLVAALEKCSVRQAALRLQQRSGLQSTAAKLTAGGREQKRELVPKKDGLEPLRWRFSPVDPWHCYLQQRGIEVATAEAFGVGYYSGPGLMRGRVVIPIHDAEGRLVAYGGRALEHNLAKYKLPPRFHKSLVLFNLHRAKRSAGDTAVVVEGFFDCMKVHQAGWGCVVALMGSCLSVEQEKLLCQRFPRIVLMLDGDEAGRKGSAAITERLRGKCRLRICQLGVGEQPDQFSSEQIQKMLESDVEPW